MQYSQALVDAQLACIQSTIGGSGVLKFFSGALPANCAASDPSGLLGTITLPSTFMGSPSGGAVALSGSWTTTWSSSGTVACFRMYDGSGNCHCQGSCGTSSADMVLSTLTAVATVAVTVTSDTVTAGNYP